MGRTSDAKEKLLEVAFQLIWDNSYGGVSVDQICERAKVNKGSFYYYFGSKADLAIAAYDEHWKKNQPVMDCLFSAQTPPLDRLRKWCNHVYESQRAKSQAHGCVCGCPYSSIGVEVATQDNKIRAKVDELIGRGTRYIEAAVADAQREGLAGEGEAKQLARQVYSYMLGSVLRAKIGNDAEVLRDLWPTVAAILRVKQPEVVSA